MSTLENPFHDLWLTEILSPQDFVRMFSPKIVDFAEHFFGSGNVIVRGRQGSGKSMLLRLLDTKTRIAYAKADEVNPIPGQLNFICGSINLTRSNISAMSGRLPPNPKKADTDWAARTFADFLNYSLAANLIANIQTLAEAQNGDEVSQPILDIDLSVSKQGQLLALINNDDQWYGAMKNCRGLDDVLDVCNRRISDYLSYFNFNATTLNPQIEESKTQIGQPLSVLAKSLRDSGVLPSDCLVYLKIDQHEELFELERETGLGDVFRQVINKALSTRDPQIAYRIGTRHYSWSRQVKVWGTSAHLEDMRDYLIVDIDEILRRPEGLHIGDSAFRRFAEDVFERRLKVAGFDFDCVGNVIRDVFGSTPYARERARGFSTLKSKQRLKYSKEWAPEWIDLFRDLRESDPLEAKLGEAWLRQRLQQKERVFADGSLSEKKPWKKRRWWGKERSEVALMQLASETGQNMAWYGDHHILELSGWNVLAFMSICRAVWSGWVRRQENLEDGSQCLPRIGKSEQVVGIFEASKMWVDKLREGQDGDRRREFILQLGEWFSKTLKEDKSLSNPGHNGFSLLRTEFERPDPTNSLIQRCRDYGDLIETTHTSKNTSGPRVKWYLNPILCPYFGLPHVRIKEPIYASLEDVKKCAKRSAVASGVGDNLDLFES